MKLIIYQLWLTSQAIFGTSLMIDKHPLGVILITTLWIPFILGLTQSKENAQKET